MKYSSYQNVIEEDSGENLHTNMPATWTPEPSVGTCTEVYLLIDDTYFFLIDDTYKLIIDRYGTCWDNEAES